MSSQHFFERTYCTMKLISILCYIFLALVLLIIVFVILCCFCFSSFLSQKEEARNYEWLRRKRMEENAKPVDSAPLAEAGVFKDEST